MSKCFPYKTSSQSVIKGQAVFHAHISLGYLDCSKIQNYECGKERNIQTKLSATAFSGKTLSYQSFLLCQGCGICCTWHVQFHRARIRNTAISPQFSPPPIFHVFSVSHRCTLIPAPQTTGVMEIGFNFYSIFSICHVFSDWKGLDQALLWGKKGPNYVSINNYKACTFTDPVFCTIWWHCRWAVHVEGMKGDSWTVNSCSWGLSLVYAWTAFGSVAFWSVTGLIIQINGMFSFWSWREQACVCVAYIIQANSDLEMHCTSRTAGRSSVSASSFQGVFGDLWSSHVVV